MKIGVISDIHSNIVAFKACTKYLEEQGCDEYLLLGDYISDTPYTRETLDYLYEFIDAHTCHLLRGNREDYMLGQQRDIEAGISENIWLYNSASGNLKYAYELLDDKDLEFFKSLPISFDYVKEGYPTIKCCHGSPDNSRQLVQLGSDEAKYWLEKIDCDYMICAHTHFPGEFAYKDRHYFNAGCVGIAINDAGFAQCMILRDCVQDGKVVWKPEFMKIPYDNKKVVRDIFALGLFEKGKWFVNSNIQILLTGIDHAADMVSLAAELARKAGDTTPWPNIDDHYFEMASKELGIPEYRLSESF